MSDLSRIGSTQLQKLQPLSEELSLARTSQPLLSDDSVAALSLLMAETQARYPNQVLPEGTPDMYLAEWERMAARFGLHEFRDALLRTIQDRERPRFFPDPLEIEDRLRANLRSKNERKKTLDELTALNVAKTVWMLEREEDIANGIERMPPAARSPQRVFPKRHTREEIAAYVAQNTKPEQLAEVRERMNSILAKEETATCA
jgi:hypothetical protein